jgi:hypothetical protein
MRADVIVLSPRDLGSTPESIANFTAVRRFDGRQELVADAIARVARVCVRSILTPGELVTPGIALDLLPPGAEEGAKDAERQAFDFSHAVAAHCGQTRGTGAPTEPEEQCLDLIIRMVPEEQSGRADLARCFGEVTVPGIARRSFNRNLPLRRKRSHILACAEEDASRLVREPLHELGIVRALRPQAVIQMTYHHVARGGLHEGVQERYGIAPAGHAHEVRRRHLIAEVSHCTGDSFLQRHPA